MEIFFELPANLNDGIGVYSYELATRLAQKHIIKFYNWHTKRVEVLTENFVPYSQHPPQNKIVKFLRSIPFGSCIINTLKKYQNYRIAKIIEGSLSNNTLYYCPSYLPKTFKYKTIITIHDLSHLRHPEFHPADRVEFLNKYLPKAIKKATAIVTVSEFSKKEIIHFFPKIKEKKIHVISNAPRKIFKPIKQADCTKIMQEYGLRYKRYFLSLATLEPRKNIEGIIKAHKKLPNKVRAKHPLILAGRYGWSSNLQADENIKILGFIPTENLPILMSGAMGFIFPSFYEGFGIPVVEAINCKVPIITSNTSSLPEICNGFALLVNPNKYEEITDAMNKIIENSYPNHLIENAYKYVSKNYNWDNSATQLYSYIHAS